MKQSVKTISFLLSLGVFLTLVWASILAYNNISRIRVEWYIRQFEEFDDLYQNKFLAAQTRKHADKFDVQMLVSAIRSAREKTAPSLAINQLVEHVEGLTHINRENFGTEPSGETYKVTEGDLAKWEEFGRQNRTCWTPTVLVLLALAMLMLTARRTILLYSVIQGIRRRSFFGLFVIEPLFLITASVFVLLAFMPVYMPNTVLVQPITLTLGTLMISLVASILSVFASYMVALRFVRIEDKTDIKRR